MPKAVLLLPSYVKYSITLRARSVPTSMWQGILACSKPSWAGQVKNYKFVHDLQRYTQIKALAWPHLYGKWSLLHTVCNGQCWRYSLAEGPTNKNCMLFIYNLLAIVLLITFMLYSPFTQHECVLLAVWYVLLHSVCIKEGFLHCSGHYLITMATKCQ